MLNLKPMPGRWGRIYYRNKANNQRHGQGKLVDLSDPTAALAQIQQTLRQYPKSTHMDVLASNSLAAPILDTIQLQAPPALAGPTPPSAVLAPLASPEAPPALDPMTGFLFQQQQQRLAEARDLTRSLQDQLRMSNAENDRLKTELADKVMELRFKDREHELDKAITAASTAQEAQPRGLGALPQPMLEGLMGMAMKFFAPAVGAAGAAPAQLPAASDGHRQVLQGIIDLVPTEELASQVYAVLSRVLATPGGMNHLLQFAGLAQPQAQPHSQQPDLQNAA